MSARKRLPLTARRCFLARQDRVTLYLGPHLDILGSVRPELERRRAAAFRIWTRFRPVWFRAGIPLRVRRLFPGAGGFNSVYGSGIPSHAIPRRKMMRGKATIGTRLEDGTEKSAQSTEGRCGISLAWYHLPRNFTFVAFNGTRTS